jgi:RNA polymerase sigma-70 factor (ECF subfamily)
MQNNHANFTALHNRLRSSLHNFISLRVKNREEVDDLVQEVFLKAFYSWKTLPEDSSAKNLLFYIARQKMIDLWKSARKRYEYDGDMSLEDFDQESGDPLPFDLFVENERKEEVHKLLSNLKPEERQILYLRFIEEKDYSEISEILSISLESARQKVSRALQNTRKVVRGHSSSAGVNKNNTTI